MQPLDIAALKRIRAVELFAEGRSYSQIARQVGFTNRGSAYRAVTNGLSMYGNTTIETLRSQEFDRLDQIHAANWKQALAGDIAATTVCLEVSRQRRRWLGRPKQPQPRSNAGILVQPWLEGTPHTSA